MQRKQAALWNGPHRVTGIINDCTLEIYDDIDKITAKCHVSRLKPYVASEYWNIDDYNNKVEKGELEDVLSEDEHANYKAFIARIVLAETEKEL